MGRISRFSTDQKLKTVFEFKTKKKSISQLTQELGLHKSGKDIYRWTMIFEDEGVEGLSTKNRNKHYSKELKEAAVKDYLHGEGSYNDISRKYGISSPSILENWITNYNENYDYKIIRKTVNKKSKLDNLKKENQLLKKELRQKEKEIMLIKKVEAMEESIVSKK